MNINDSYISNALLRPCTTVKNICKGIRKYFPECEGVVVSSGLSGSLLVIPIAKALRKPFAITRNKNSHSMFRVEGYKRTNNYVIVDDLIDTGRTITDTIKKMQRWNNSKPIGVVLYNCPEDRTRNNPLRNKKSFGRYKLPVLILDKQGKA